MRSMSTSLSYWALLARDRSRSSAPHTKHIFTTQHWHSPYLHNLLQSVNTCLSWGCHTQLELKLATLVSRGQRITRAPTYA